MVCYTAIDNSYRNWCQKLRNVTNSKICGIGFGTGCHMKIWESKGEIFLEKWEGFEETAKGSWKKFSYHLGLVPLNLVNSVQLERRY